MIDSTSIQLRDGLRYELSAKMAEWERANGPIQTIPIICGEDKRMPFNITSCEKGQEPAAARVMRDLKDKRLTANETKKRQSAKKIDILRKMAPKGAKIVEMSDATGLTANVIMRYLREHKIERGPKMDLEAV